MIGDLDGIDDDVDDEPDLCLDFCMVLNGFLVWLVVSGAEEVLTLVPEMMWPLPFTMPL